MGGGIPDDDTPVVHGDPTFGDLVLQISLFIPVLFFNLFPDFKWAPLGRPPVNVFCALMAIMTGVVREKEAFDAVDYGTLMFLIGMMLMAAYLDRKRHL